MLSSLITVYPQTHIISEHHIIDGNITLHDNLLAFWGHVFSLCGVSHWPHQFGMLVFGLCISQPVQPVQCYFPCEVYCLEMYF